MQVNSDKEESSPEETPVVSRADERAPRKPRGKPKTASSSAESDIERLHKRIAASGLCSRRAAEELISHGRVQVNGETIVQMGVKVGPEDEIRVDGIVVSSAKICTLIMNKPAGYLTTLSDPQRRPTVTQLLPDLGFMVKPVGRLDFETEGLLLFTNDGTLAHRLSHPRYGVEKEYHATVKGIPEEQSLERLRKGIWIEEGGKTAPAQVEMGYVDRKGATTSLRITIHEGRKRQVRLMCEAVGHEVTFLRRVRFGPLILKNLAPGACRLLGVKEVDQLKRLVGLEPHFGSTSTGPKPKNPVGVAAPNRNTKSVARRVRTAKPVGRKPSQPSKVNKRRR